MSQTNDLPEIQQRLTETGWREINFGFNLGRKSHALDFQKRERFLIFRSSPPEQANYDLLRKHHLPCFLTTYFNHLAPTTGVAEIPLIARALDSLRYPEKHPATGYLGAFETLGAVAELLKRIADKTAKAIPNLDLARLAVTVGETEIIKLIPPLELITFTSYKQLTERLTSQLLRSLQRQDPANDHSGQTDFFRYKLEERYE